MPDWTKGKIYLIWSPHTDKVYIGSTTLTLNARFNKHIHDIKYNQGCSSEEIINLGDAEIRLIHLCPSFTKQELKFQEGRVMRLFENRVNIRMEGQTEEEIRQKKTNTYAIGRKNARIYWLKKNAIGRKNKKIKRVKQNAIGRKSKKTNVMKQGGKEGQPKKRRL